MTEILAGSSSGETQKIIVITGKQLVLSHSLPYEIVSDCIRFSLFGCRSSNSFYRAGPPALHPTPIWRTTSVYLSPPSDMVTQFCLQPLGSLLVSFYGLQGCGDVSERASKRVHRKSYEIMTQYAR
jgi:hypothetical protein